eukprot:CAMPEP_0178721182 /NCGR_PEP_ID=MMETSP0699-20121125/24167_1 /TAXON_ID=265572 /ORGANISM="Extubocellulus spinifer, Strain CCMP396" /LENGTH=86 /DNA_ID=CAMNT_0020371759 /DNA_START=476 /DNA_END=737 /DNA_ORIENTATION=+
MRPLLSPHINIISLFQYTTCRRNNNEQGLRPSVSLNAETEEWTAPPEWKEKDFEAQIKKLEKEAEERLDTKIDELKRNIATAGKSD